MSNKIYNLILITYNFILDLLFPKYCLGCGREGFWICPSCQKKIVFIQKPTCPLCNRLTSRGQFCPRCRPHSYLTGLLVAAYYKEGPLKEAIHTFKYEGVFDLAKDLGQLLIARLSLKTPQGWHKEGTLIIPVPLPKKRQAQRGFNQAEFLARQLAMVNSKWLLLINRLIRHKATKKTQVELSGKARRENVQGVFSWRGEPDELKGKTILLVDDIYTTGATLQECAKVLRQQAGARQVWGVVLAKT